MIFFFFFFPLLFYSAFEFKGLSAKRQSQKFTVGEVGTSLALYFPFGKMAGFYNVKSYILFYLKQISVVQLGWLMFKADIIASFFHKTAIKKKRQKKKRF